MGIKYLISLDGGGVREIATVVFLSRLEEALGKPLHEQFDFFVGCFACGGSSFMFVCKHLRNPTPWDGRCRKSSEKSAVFPLDPGERNTKLIQKNINTLPVRVFILMWPLFVVE